MLTRFVCLANSYKEGGKCIAGIELDNNNNPIIENGHPKWIRPVCDTPHGEFPHHIAEPFQLLDIIQIDLTKHRPESYQSENVLFTVNSLRIIGTFDKHQLDSLCENRKYIFATRYPSLSEEAIKDLTYSLMLIKPAKFEVMAKVSEERPDKRQQRLVFLYNELQYDLSITDPVFLKMYQQNHDFIKNTDEVYLCLSVGVKFPITNRHYKLVAAIIIK